MTGAVHRRREGIDIAPLAERSRYQQSFIQCMNLWEDDAEVAAADLPSAHRSGGRRAARGRRDPPLARPGALQGGGRPRDRRAPGPPLLADRRDCLGHSVDPARRFDARIGCDGLRARQPPHRHAQVRQHLLRRTGGHPCRPRDRAASSRCSSRCRAGSVCVPPRADRAPREAEHDRPRPRRPHDHLLPRRQHPRVPVPSLQRGPRRRSRSARSSTATRRPSRGRAPRVSRSRRCRPCRSRSAAPSPLRRSSSLRHCRELEQGGCGRRDSNPHGSLHRDLNPARLPVPPRPRRREDGTRDHPR